MWNLVTRRNSCPHCGGNGKCPECSGTGVNVHLNSDDPKCPACEGTGTCSECGGSGKFSLHGDSSVPKLFDE